MSITETLYDWMHRRRIMTEVAREMGISVNTLAGELRTTNRQAKLGADELVPLFAAIRRIGYGHELRGILHGFIRDLRGENGRVVDESEFEPGTNALSRCVQMLCASGSHLNLIQDEDELVLMRTMIRTELLSAAMRMEAVLDARIMKMRKARNRGALPGTPLADLA